MREAKFRAWLVKKNEYQYFTVRAGLYGYTREESIVEQFTGLLDKNDVEVYALLLFLKKIY